MLFIVFLTHSSIDGSQFERSGWLFGILTATPSTTVRGLKLVWLGLVSSNTARGSKTAIRISSRFPSLEPIYSSQHWLAAVCSLQWLMKAHCLTLRIHWQILAERCHEQLRFREPSLLQPFPLGRSIGNRVSEPFWRIVGTLSNLWAFCAESKWLGLSWNHRLQNLALAKQSHANHCEKSPRLDVGPAAKEFGFRCCLIEWSLHYLLCQSEYCLGIKGKFFSKNEFSTNMTHRYLFWVVS